MPRKARRRNKSSCSVGHGSGGTTHEHPNPNEAGPEGDDADYFVHEVIVSHHVRREQDNDHNAEDVECEAHEQRQEHIYE